MATRHLGKIGRWVLWYSPLVIVPVGFFVLGPWENEAVGPACAIFIVGYSIFLAERVTRRFDEVQIAGGRFANAKGMTIGIFGALLVMLFPPSMSALTDLAQTVGSASPERAVQVGIVFGYMLLVLLQTVGAIVASIWWERRLGRSA